MAKAKKAKRAKHGKATITGCKCGASSTKDSKLGFPSYVRCRSKGNGRFTKFQGCKRAA